MNPAHFLADLQRKPDALEALATALAGGNPWAQLPQSTSDLLLVGMGSSYYAAATFAARLRSRGVRAVAERASSELLTPIGDDPTVVAISAGGTSPETLDAVQRLRGRCRIAVLTNDTDSPLAAYGQPVVPMLAGHEHGGVACRSYQHTLALLMALEAHLTQASLANISTAVALAAEASGDLLNREGAWREQVGQVLLGPDGSHLVAPAERLCSARQSALMLREGPRRPAVACETGDWSHVDLYLAKNTDYRLLLFAGSRWERTLFPWTSRRRVPVVSVGPCSTDTAVRVRYFHDEIPDVALLTEPLVVELVAARDWQQRVEENPSDGTSLEQRPR